VKLSVLNKEAFSAYRLHSRVHPLRSFTQDACFCYIKRDDELSFSISGSKLRKYSSLIPQIIKSGVKQVLLIGGAFSNHILGLSQLLIENGLIPILFLRQAGSDQIQGNLLLIKTLVDAKQIHWISRKEWQNVETIVRKYQEESHIPSYIVPEGACMEEALPGALTLFSDILENQNELQVQFDHIFIEAGTGTQAIALILGMQSVLHTAKIHVVLLADTEEAFKDKLERFSKKTFSEQNLPSNFEIHFPKSAASFGSVTSEGFNFLKEFAKKEGVFLDPIYSVKLFQTGYQVIRENKLKGNILFIHSGGALTLMGFIPQLLST